MSPERRVPKSTRKRIRGLKSQVRAELGLTRPQADSALWIRTEEILKSTLSSYDETFAPHTPILREFFEIRREIDSGEPLAKIAEFQQKHGKEKLYALSPAFILIRRILQQKQLQ